MDHKPSPFLARTHRKRSSITKLSSDTTATLPAYLCTEQLPDDNPPDYPESANEADADSESDHIAPDMLPPARTSPRTRRVHSHGRRHTVSPIISSPTDPYLDSLLARSVHALEMSNALLQSSISTHSSLSAALAVDSPIVESSLEARARILSSRIRVNSGVHANWLDDLATISEHVTTDAQPDALGLSLAPNDIVSWSLPVDPSPLRLRTHHHRNYSSSDLRLTDAETSNPDRPHLCFSNWPRSRLISPAPRALTQYIESNADPDTIQLPSTIGIRSSPSTYFSPGVSSPPASRPPSPPIASGSTLAESSTTAYTLLCSVLDRRPSTSSTDSLVVIHSRPECRVKARRSSADSATSSSRASSTIIPSRRRTPHSSPSCSRVGKRSLSPRPIPPSPAPQPRLLTTPTENPSLSSLSSTPSSNPSSDPHPNPILSVQALRKILDDQPHSQNMSCAQPISHRPTFLPRSPLPPPTLGTSTATASVSRLFTKPVHMHSGSSSREPRPSALKSGLRTPQSPPPSSTPNGFLEPGTAWLPEPYGSERGGAGSGRGFEKSRSRRTTKKRSGKGKGKDKIKGKDKGKARVNLVDDESEGSDRDEEEEDEEEGKGWWLRLLLGSGSTRGLSLGRTEDRIESRIARGLGSRGGFGGGMEDWAV
ncbi:hypothetical protein BGW80DRAFT_1455867 [Lactifluus volemus]|nr:hypothetical protein BGW80DRAFT_1455867 [Lactifluus volemus]